MKVSTTTAEFREYADSIAEQLACSKERVFVILT